MLVCVFQFIIDFEIRRVIIIIIFVNKLLSLDTFMFNVKRDFFSLGTRRKNYFIIEIHFRIEDGGSL